MSFEDLQKQWAGQFPADLPAPDAKMEAELLERVRRDERGFRFMVLLGIVRDILFFSVAIGMLVLVVRHGLPLPKEIIRKYRMLVLLGGGGPVLLTMAAARGRLWATPSAAEGRSALPDRVLRDRGRFDAIIIWRDARETLAALVVLFFAIFQAATLPAHEYAALAWVGTGFFFLSPVFFLIYRYRSKRLRPAWDGTVLGMLALSIHQTRRQVHLLENLWWYIIPFYLGILLTFPVRRMLVHGRVFGPELVGVAMATAILGGMWGLNLWVARNKLRPRMEQLEKLHSELSIGS